MRIPAATAMMAAVLLTVSGCGGERPQDVLVRTLENVARAACDDAASCTNRCADGAPTDRRGRGCDGVRRP